MIPLILLSILALCLGFLPAYLILPGFIARMKAAGNVGVDVNKKGKPMVAESGGNSALSAETQHALSGVLSFPN